MKVKFENYSDVSCWDWKRLYTAVNVAMKELNLDFLPGRITVEMLPGTVEGFYGDSVDEGCNHYTIRVCDLGDVYRTLFHELAHVFQYAWEGLSIETDRAHFRGEDYFINVKEWESYYNAPWEVEARQLEEQLLEAWEKYFMQNIYKH